MVGTDGKTVPSSLAEAVHVAWPPLSTGSHWGPLLGPVGIQVCNQLQGGVEPPGNLAGLGVEPGTGHAVYAPSTGL